MGVLLIYAKKNILNKYFTFLIDSVGSEVFQIISLLWKFPMNTILSHNLSRLLSDYMFDF